MPVKALIRHMDSLILSTARQRWRLPHSLQLEPELSDHCGPGEEIDSPLAGGFAKGLCLAGVGEQFGECCGQTFLFARLDMQT